MAASFIASSGFCLSSPRLRRSMLEEVGVRRVFKCRRGLVQAVAVGVSVGVEGEKDGLTTDEDKALAELAALIPFDVLRDIAKPGRYLGNERGAVRKDWNSSKVRMCLAYPEVYEIGMSNTGHVILYSCVNDVDGALCDRSYLPGPDMSAALKSLDKGLFAVESKRALSEFDILAVPVHYEMGATNCLELLSLSNLPILSEDRNESVTKTFDPSKGSFPLVFGGGQTITANPEPFVDFFDFFALGDGEDTLPLVAKKVSEAKELQLSRDDVLLKLAQEVPGVYVPKFFKRLEDGSVRRIREDIPARPTRQIATPQPERALQLVPYVATIHDRLTIEIRRGCTRGCRFCLPGNLNRPGRDVEPERVIKGVLEGVQKSGYREFSLLSLSCSDWLSLPAVGIELKNKLREHNTNISLSLPSQRVDRFDENIAVLINGGEEKRSGITFAPEAGTQRMRDVINKGLTNEELLRGVRTAYHQGYAQVKLYFMIGLPGETDDDVLGIAETVRWLQRECKDHGRRRLSVKLTISNFTPKPHTPFQWHSVSADEFRRKQGLLKKAFRNQRDVKVNYTDVRISAMEDFIGRADRRLSRVIQRAWENGASMDDWWMDMDRAYKSWMRAIEECGLSWEYRKTENGEWNVIETPKETVRGKRGWFTFAKKLGLDFKTLTPKIGWLKEEESGGGSATISPLDRPLPWDHINSGVDKGWLRDELMKALSETLTPDCAFHECSSCGVCGDAFGNNVVIPPPPIPEFQGHYRSEWNREQRLRVKFRRYGASSFLSHLDVNRMLDRALLRSSLPISFTNGFNQQPRVQPAQPLPLGMTSDAEIFDFEMVHSLDPADFQARLGEQLPSSFSIQEVRDVPLKFMSPSASLLEVEWVVALVKGAESESSVDWDGCVEKVLMSGPVETIKISKRSKRKRTVDLRLPLMSMSVATPAEAEPLLVHIGVEFWDQDTFVVKYRQAVQPEYINLNPTEFAKLVGTVLGAQVNLRHAHKKDIVLDEKVRPKKEKVEAAEETDIDVMEEEY